MADSYDFVIAGAGSAGCALAARLSEDGKTRVLLLDAGPDSKTQVGPEMQQNLAEPVRFQFMQDSWVDWKYSTEPVPGLGNRRIGCPRGKLIGGCSTFMAGMAIRGNSLDYDDWARDGNPGWRYPEVLPYFKKLEANYGSSIETPFHGLDGPMVVSDLPRHSAAGWAFLEAAQAMGHRRNYDFNGARQEGVGYFQTYVKDGVRVNSAGSYLTDEVRARPNLTIKSFCLATQVLLERGKRGWRAVALAYEDQTGGGRVAATAAAGREVIVACGTIDSPKLLMLSGLGPERELRKHGIDPKVHLPGVGKNLMDHVIAPVVYTYKPGHGPGGVIDYGIEGGMFLKTSGARRKPDLQMILNHALLGPPQTPVVPVAFMVVPLLVNPESRGEVRLASADPNAAPLIFGNYLAAPADLALMVYGVKLGLRLALHSAFEAFRGPRMFPPPGKDPGAFPSDREIVDFIRQFAGTLFHPAGTCRMGPRPNDPKKPAVVDTCLRVHGVEALRVVDASIMPHITTGNTHTPTTMIAEKAAAMLRTGP